jgi:hypothetical protein
LRAKWLGRSLSRRDGVTGELNKSHNAEINNFYYSVRVIRKEGAGRTCIKHGTEKLKHFGYETTREDTACGTQTKIWE